MTGLINWPKKLVCSGSNHKIEKVLNVEKN